MEIKKKIVGDKLEVAISGRLDTTTAPELDAAFAAEGDKWKGVIVDASELEYVSSAGLRVLLSEFKKLGSLKVTGANETIKEVFDITGLSDLFEIE